VTQDRLGWIPSFLAGAGGIMLFGLAVSNATNGD